MFDVQNFNIVHSSVYEASDIVRNISRLNRCLLTTQTKFDGKKFSLLSQTVKSVYSKSVYKVYKVKNYRIILRYH